MILKQTIIAYLKASNMELTYERQVMIDILDGMESFDSERFINEASRQLKLNNGVATPYNFLSLLYKARILLKKEVIPARFNQDEAEIMRVISECRGRPATSDVVQARIESSYR